MSNWHKEQPIGLMLHDTARAMRKLFDQQAKHMDLTRAQWRVLIVLLRRPGIKQAVMAEYLDIEPISMSRLVDRMEDAGWVRREQDPSDRRARLLYMTDQAVPVMDELAVIAGDINTQALEGLSTNEVETFVATLNKIRSNLSDKTALSQDSGTAQSGNGK